MKKLLSGFIIIINCVCSYAQTQSGILFGGGLGFENTSLDKSNPTYIKGKVFSDSYSYSTFLGYRFRFENVSNKNLFFDIDPLMKLQVFKSSIIPLLYQNPPYSEIIEESHKVNYALAISSSINYRISGGLYIGAGIEPTWNIVTDGKHLDAPVLGRIGYNCHGKVDFALTYKHGFTNVINTDRYTKGRISDLSLSVFIPFKSK